MQSPSSVSFLPPGPDVEAAAVAPGWASKEDKGTSKKRASGAVEEALQGASDPGNRTETGAIRAFGSMHLLLKHLSPISAMYMDHQGLVKLLACIA
jgi:hypothetical protein